MWVKGRGTDGSKSRWPTCVIGSGVAHLVLLVACVLLSPTPENSRSILRVKLLDGASAPETIPTVTDGAREPALTSAAVPPRPRLRRPVRQAIPTASEQRVGALPSEELLPHPAAVPVEIHEPPLAQRTPSPTADGAQFPPVVAAPPVVEQAEPPGPLPAHRDAGARGPLGSRDEGGLPSAGGGSGSSAPTPWSAAEPRGTFLYDGQGKASGAGNGSRVGSGNGDGWGSGAGAGGASGGGGGQAGGSTQVARAGNGVGPGSGAGSGGRNSDQLLRTIRRQIERVWTYPDAARRDGVQGRVELRFRIAADGSAENVEILRSSGHAILDDDLTQTVRRAGPYPLYSGWVRLPFTYRLAE